MLTEKQRRWLQKVLDADPGALPEGDDEASVRKRYQARRRQLDPALGSLDDYLQSSQLKSAAAPVRAAAKVYNTERKAVDDAAQKKDFKTAEKALARLETAVSNLTRAAGDRSGRAGQGSEHDDQGQTDEGAAFVFRGGPTGIGNALRGVGPCSESSGRRGGSDSLRSGRTLARVASMQRRAVEGDGSVRVRWKLTRSMAPTSTAQHLPDSRRPRLKVPRFRSGSIAATTDALECSRGS